MTAGSDPLEASTSGRPDLAKQAATAEFRIGRLLIAMTYAAVAVLVVGVVLMVGAGISPLDPGPAFDPAELVSQLTSLTPAGFLWLGLVIVIATPIVRVIGAAISFGLTRQWTMVAIAIAILIVIASGVVIALTVTG
jgi:uncharacterized membrane protein